MASAIRCARCKPCGSGKQKQTAHRVGLGLLRTEWLIYCTQYGTVLEQPGSTLGVG